MSYTPTETELKVLRAYLDNGTCKAAGSVLGVSEQAIKQHLWRMRLKARVESTQQLMFALYAELRAQRPVL